MAHKMAIGLPHRPSWNIYSFWHTQGQQPSDQQDEAGDGGGDCIHRSTYPDTRHCHRKDNYGTPCKEVMKSGECEHKTAEASP